MGSLVFLLACLASAPNRSKLHAETDQIDTVANREKTEMQVLARLLLNSVPSIGLDCLVHCRSLNSARVAGPVLKSEVSADPGLYSESKLLRKPGQALDPHFILMAVLGPSETAIAEAIDILAARLGRSVACRSPTYTQQCLSRYYEPEMGDGLCKRLIVLDGEASPACLGGLKRKCIELELELAEASGDSLRRQVNIDPGLLSGWSLKLASCKYAAHKVCVEPGLYVDPCLDYSDGEWRPFRWTYPDLREAKVLSFLHDVRREIIMPAGRTTEKSKRGRKGRSG